MSAANNCACPCPDPTITEIPGSPGEDGAAGTAGTNGVNAFTTLTGNVLIPAVNANVTANVVNSTWMSILQVVILSDGTHSGTFQVVSLPGSTSVQLKFLGYGLDSLPGVTISSTGGTVSPSGQQPASPVPVASGGTASTTATNARAALGIGGANLAVYASGTAYALTATPALLALGTTTPSLTITSAGVWLIMGRARIDNNAKTTAAVRTITLKLRRTNNTAADLANSSTSCKTAIMTTLTFTLEECDLPQVIYTTTNSNDIIQLWGSADDISGAGTFDAVEASIVAVKLYDQTV